MNPLFSMYASHVVRLALAAALGAPLLLPLSAQAVGSFTPGQRLSAEQMNALGALSRLEIEGRSYQVLPSSETRGGGLTTTWVIDENGVVGQSHNELIITQQPTDAVRQQLAALKPQPVAAKFYDSTQVTLLRFASLAQAQSALIHIRTALPGAQMSLPIQWALPKAY